VLKLLQVIEDEMFYRKWFILITLEEIRADELVMGSKLLQLVAFGVSRLF